jgi:subtilisin family serine protease
MNGRRMRVAVVLAVSVALAVPAAGLALAGASGGRATVAPLVLRQTVGGRSASFLVVLRSQADVSASATLATKDAKDEFVYRTLRSWADRTQAPIVAALDRMGAPHRSHFLVNMLTVTGDRRVVDALAARPDVARIEPNVKMRSTNLLVGPPRAAPVAPDAIEWNIRRVRAPNVWAQGFTGQGIVVGNIDTGEQWDHPALKPHYRGWNGSTASHDYNWWDATDSSNRAPIDPNSHGTLTAGIIVGGDGGSNRIGVAPGAKWFACRAMDVDGFGSPDTYTTCFEFMMAPWDLNGQNPDPTKAPVAVSNSWFCNISEEGCTQSILYQVVKNVKAAGIVPVVGAGNSGPTCSSIGANGPPAQYAESYTVGATTFENGLATFSSRGPAFFQGVRIKPDIVAPGEDVRTSLPPDTYAIVSGTSISTPHITGVIALIYSAKPSLIGNVDATEALIGQTAQHLSSSECSSNGSYPNNLFGYGFVNAARATKP